MSADLQHIKVDDGTACMAVAVGFAHPPQEYHVGEYVLCIGQYHMADQLVEAAQCKKLGVDQPNAEAAWALEVMDAQLMLAHKPKDMPGPPLKVEPMEQ